jgi:hypothetical protein
MAMGMRMTLVSVAVVIVSRRLAAMVMIVMTAKIAVMVMVVVAGMATVIVAGMIVVVAVVMLVVVVTLRRHARGCPSVDRIPPCYNVAGHAAGTGPIGHRALI